MSFFNILTYITIFIVTIFFVRGLIVWLYIKFKPLKYIKLTITDDSGVNHHKKLFIDDKELIDEILKIRKKQKLPSGDHSAK